VTPVPLTSEERTYKRLREQILSGEFPSGEFLSQRMLAARTDASVITVRAVLRRLENEGLLENVPRWGVRIPAESAEDVRDRYFMREILEVAAVRRIAGKLSAEQAARLEQLAAECDGIRCDEEEAVREFAEAHARLHLEISGCAGSRLLKSCLQSISCRSVMLMNARRGWARGRDGGPTYHRDLVGLIIAGGAGDAAREIRRHIRRGLEGELEALLADRAAHDQV
jgi:DNA-binding GntR family transcriptional regulator